MFKKSLMSPVAPTRIKTMDFFKNAKAILNSEKSVCFDVTVFFPVGGGQNKNIF